MANLDISRAQRLDQRVVEQIPTLTRSYAAKLIDDGKVMVNGEVVTKAGYKMRDGDVVAVDHDEELFRRIPSIDLPVVYEDEDCVVISKPVGLLAHSKGAFNPEPTVATWLRGRLRSMQGERAGIVHRLDRATSGVMICARTPEALSWLQKQFSQRKVKKTYSAVVRGHLTEPEAVIDMPLERNPKKPQTFRVGANGKVAVTKYVVTQTDDARSLVELKPETGRTHQLRVHMAHLGHPIVGDVLYGGEPAERLYLHAHQLEITLLSRERKVFTVAVPDAFKGLMHVD
ncbi:MAG TPA: RluA family pseudouridine synthase [Candidatus Saccharimonadales bacterium]|nr:RluA family pseudouridine synthase [Candidatus Saccharimonadales bacterium]